MNRQQAPNEETLNRIRQHLHLPDARRRISQLMHDARAKATVTTSRAARLLGFGEQQLRDWDKRGLIKTERTSTLSSDDGKQSTGHRQFTLDELDKLAIIKELTDRARFTPSDLLPYIEDIGRELLFEEEQVQSQEQKGPPLANITINERIRNARAKLFWRFFAAHALRFSLFLLREDKPTGTIGLVLPLHKQGERVRITHIDDLSMLGESLVGWLNQRRFSHTMLISNPSFEYSTDYRIHPLTIMKHGEPQDEPQDNTHIIVRRDADSLSLSLEVIQTVRALLRPLYKNVEQIESCFGLDMYDMIDTTPSQDNSALYPHLILNDLANMVIHLGSRENAPDRWRFCCILLQRDSRLPVQQRTLVVIAQSHLSPHKIGVSSVPPDLDALSLLAYQSGMVCYRNKLSPNDLIIAYRNLEHPVNSAIAVPVGGEDGEPIGAIYVTSEYESAFSDVKDRRMLRIISRMVGELARTYQFRWQETDRLGAILRHPDMVDELLGMFHSENEFIHDLEAFLMSYQADREKEKQQQAAVSLEENPKEEREVKGEPEEHAISLIGIDVDHLGSLAIKYGNQAVRNLCREIGMHIQGELDSTFKKYPGCQFYHIVADRFFVLLKNVPYDQMIKKARLLKKSLDGSYRVSLFQSMGIQPVAPDTLIELAITVRLAVSSYDDATLQDLLERYPGEHGVINVREAFERGITGQLKKGMADGGNVIRAWNPKARLFEQLAAEEA